MASAGKSTVDLLVNSYRREVQGQQAAQWAAPGRNIEFEVRFQDVDAANFVALFRRLSEWQPAAAAGARVGAPELRMVVGVLMSAAARAGARPHAGAQPATNLREMHYEAGVKSREAYLRKEPLHLPWYSPRGSGLGYSVALSAETPTEKFSADENARIRVKSRVSFPLVVAKTSEPDSPTELHWRIDLTAVREFSGTEMDSIAAVVTQMFRTAPPMTAANMLSVLGVVAADGQPNLAVAAVYKFEVEIEFTAAGAAERDSLRGSDVAIAADFVLGLASPELMREAALQAAIYRIAKYLLKDSPRDLRAFEGERGLKQLLPQVRALTRSEYRLVYPPRGYFLTDKADGCRAVGISRDGRGLIVTSNSLLDGFVRPAAAAGGSGARDTYLDGELVTAADGSQTFYAFDCIVVAGADLTGGGFETRLLRLAEGVAELAAAGLPAAAKQYTHIVSGAPADIEHAVRLVYEAKRPYAVDGLIFVAPGQRYIDTVSHKWKSAHDNTIDFLARRVPPGALGRGPYVDAPGHELYMLFVGVNPAMYSALGMQRCPGYGELFTGASSTARYFPIQFSPSDSPLAYLYSHPAGGPAIDGRIVELRRAAGEAPGGARRKRAPSATPVDWELVRLREDRQRDVERGAAYFGNDFRVAEMTWLNYIDEFPLEQLWLGAGADYFATPRAGIYLAQTSVMNFAKTRLIESLRGAPFVVDLGAGRGSDLGRYASAEVGHLIAVDNDRAALAELVRRRYDMMRRRGAPIGAAAPRPPSSRGLTVHVVAADANGPAAALVAKLQAVGLPAGGADALVCNLAAHYFMATAETMKNFVAIARAVVRPGGTLALTVLAGDRVHRLFTESQIGPGECWDRFEAPAYSGPDGALTSSGAPQARKYSLRRDYSSAKLEVAGQGIGVLLPFSDGRYYPEYLLNVDALSRALAARGFGAPVRTPVSDSIGDFTAQHKPLAEELSAADREWLALYATLTYTREK